MLLPALLLAAVMLVVIARPRHVPIAVPALIGAGLAIVLRLVTLADVWRVVGLTWNATLALIGLMVLSATLQANGAFAAAAHRIARASRGDGRRLFVGLGVLTGGAATVLANDGAILILTPVVAELATALKLTRKQAIAYLFAVGFLCDALSTLLPTSNLTNILLVDALHIHAARFTAHMLLPTLVLFVVALGTLALLFRRDVPARCDLTTLGPPPPFSRRSLIATWLTLGFLLAGYTGAAFLHVPLGIVVVVVAAGLLAFEKWGDPTVRVRGLVKSLPWSIVLFAFALFVVVYALGKAGLATRLALLLDGRGSHPLEALLIAGLVVALAAGLANNLPVLLVTLLALETLVPLSPDTLPYAALLGANVGSKLTPVGSLATLLWLEILARRGLRVGWWQYTRLALLPSLLALVAALLALLI